MGAKKKGGGTKKKGGGEPEEEDISVKKFFDTYKKKKCPEFGVKVVDAIKQMFDKWEEDPEDVITKLHLWDELGWAGTRAIMDSLKAVG